MSTNEFDWASFTAMFVLPTMMNDSKTFSVREVERVGPNETSGRVVYFQCAGCGGMHCVPIDKIMPNGPKWNWDHSMDAPSLSPSVITRGPKHFCHVEVSRGKLKFLPESTHQLSGKEVPMPRLPEWFIEKHMV